MKPQPEKALRETAPNEPCKFDDQSPDEFDNQSPNDPDDCSELDEIDLDDDHWEAFLADDDERDPQPDHGDFWPEA